MHAHMPAAVVTGAGRGIGRAIALELARRGHAVALQARTADQLAGVRAEIEALGGRSRVISGDVREAAASAQLVEQCEAELGPVAVAVANAGQASSAPLLATTPDSMRALFEVNVLSALHLIQASARAMIASKTRGRIVVIASTAAIRGARYTAAYSTSKHAVLGLVRTAALELAPHGITVNAVCPGWVNTPMFDATLKNISEKTRRSEADARRQLESTIPMGSVLEPEEVAGMVAHLVSDAAGHVTGQALVMDGGEGIA